MAVCWTVESQLPQAPSSTTDTAAASIVARLVPMEATAAPRLTSTKRAEAAQYGTES